jgi:hypothetical protein
MSRRNKAVVIRFTEDEWRSLNDKVKKAKMPREKFCRVVLLGAKINAPPDADYVSLIFEVRRVGNNLNQLVRKLNVLGIVHGLELERNQNEIHEVCDMLCDTFRKVVK